MLQEKKKKRKAEMWLSQRRHFSRMLAALLLFQLQNGRCINMGEGGVAWGGAAQTFSLNLLVGHNLPPSGTLFICEMISP